MANFKIELPLFVGFYESELFNSDTLDNEFSSENMEPFRELYEDEALQPDDFDLDFGAYQKACCESFVSVFHDRCPDFVRGLEFAELWSPTFYNTTTDKVFANIELADGWKGEIITFMLENKAWLSAKIKEDWSDRDGFISMMDNTFDDWLSRFRADDMDARYISVMLGYMLLNEDDEIESTLVWCTLEDVCISEFLTNTKEKVEG